MPTGSTASILPDGYEFVREVGAGATGWVALARQTSLDRLVAVKIVHAEADLVRLHREGQAFALLTHPHIVEVYALLPCRAGVAMVMEYVAGTTLRAALDSDGLPPVDAVRVLGEVAGALGYAHSRGIVHRDVKPANVLLTQTATARLGDFGLARIASPTAFRTVSGESLRGTPAYLAPEQIAAPALAAPSGDAYSFAVLAYEVLTGASPYQVHDVISVLHAHLEVAPTSPWEYAPHLPPAVGAVLLAGLAKDPARRASPKDIAAELARVPPDRWAGVFTTRRTSTLTTGEQSSTLDRTAGGVLEPVAAELLATDPYAGVSIPLLAPDSTIPLQRRPRRIVTIGLGVAVGVVVGIVMAVLAHR